MGQTNINVPSDGSSGGYGAGMIVGLVLAVLVIGFIGLDLGSIRFGADSRDQLPDTHVR